MRKMFGMLMLLLMFNPLIAQAWNALGHKVITRIAYEQLEPAVKKKIDTLVSLFNQDYPKINTFEELSVWPDAIRGQKIETYTHWHYIDIPLTKSFMHVDADLDTDNAVWALSKIQPVVENEKANQFERARFLAFFVHIVEDLHQPLHTVSYFSAEHPEGDRGGNDYKVYYHNKLMKLHFIWDKGIGVFDDAANTKNTTMIARRLMHDYPPNYFAQRTNDFDPNSWVKEGLKNAQEIVYDTKENGVVSQQYITAGKKLAEEEAALAGYRLGKMLNQLLH